MNVHLPDEGRLLWSPLARAQLTRATYGPFIEWIIRQIERANEHRSADISTPDENISAELDRLARALRLDPFKRGSTPSRATIYRWLDLAREYGLIKPAGASERDDWRAWATELWLVALAAEWHFVPYAQGVIAAIRFQPSHPVIDAQSALHAIWFSFRDGAPKLGRALGMVLHEPGRSPWLFAPFTGLLEEVLARHIPDPDGCRELAATLAQRASIAFCEGPSDDTGMRGLVVPCIAILREAGLSQPDEVVEEGRISELLYSLATSESGDEHARLRAALAPLVRSGALNASGGNQ